MAAYNTHVALMVPFDLFKPKHHIMFHLIQQTRHFGNPNAYACWLDEALNKMLKTSCKNVSQSTYEMSVLYNKKEILKALYHDEIE